MRTNRVRRPDSVLRHLRPQHVGRRIAGPQSHVLLRDPRSSPGPRDSVCGAASTGKAIARAASILIRDLVAVPWASSLPEARSLCPNYSLYWTVLLDALDSGARVFDFGRSSISSGTLHFKKQWGTELEPLAWTRLDRNGERHSAALLGSTSERRSGLDLAPASFGGRQPDRPPYSAAPLQLTASRDARCG